MQSKSHNCGYSNTPIRIYQQKPVCCVTCPQLQFLVLIKCSDANILFVLVYEIKIGCFGVAIPITINIFLLVGSNWRTFKEVPMVWKRMDNFPKDTQAFSLPSLIKHHSASSFVYLWLENPTGVTWWDNYSTQHFIIDIDL